MLDVYTTLRYILYLTENVEMEGMLETTPKWPLYFSFHFLSLFLALAIVTLLFPPFIIAAEIKNTH